MRNKKQIKNDFEILKSMGGIVEAYEEIAAMRMRKVKKSVLQNREFLSGLGDVYQDIYKAYLLESGRKHRAKDWVPFNTNGKSVSVLLSANTGLYGDIIKETFDFFVTNTSNKNADIIVVGRVGRLLYEFQNTKREYKYFELSDSSVNRDEIKNILDTILKYSNIAVYHGLYMSILNQEPTITFVTGKASDIQKVENKTEIKYIVEPSVEEVASFFERQILSSIFEQTLYESALSKFASRMVSLDVANENIINLVKVNLLDKLKLKHTEDNKIQQDSLTGISLWNN